MNHSSTNRLDSLTNGAAQRSSSDRLRLAGGLTLGLLGLAATSCGSGGKTPGGVTGGAFQLVAVSGMPVGAQSSWKINRRMEFMFSADVDFNSVDSSSILIRKSDGEQALGEYFAKALPGGGVDLRTVVFQPRCPTEPDLSDSGLDIGAAYEVLILGADGGSGIAVRSAAQVPLATSQYRNFVTPTSTLPADLFFDVKSGPPEVLLVNSQNSVGSHVRVGGPGGSITNFTKTNGIADVIPNMPVNLYSGGSQSLEVFLEFDQPVNPAASNINSSRVRLQFESPPLSNTWIDLPTDVTLEKNCTETGALVRLDPIGILPPDVLVRVRISATFEDLIGDQNTLPVDDFARFETRIELAASFNPQVFSDELFEGFDDTERLDDTALPFLPRANWGGGRLQASFEFPKSPDVNLPADFDFVVLTGTTRVINTVLDAVGGGPGTAITYTQTVDKGMLFVRDLVVQPGSTLRFEGKNSARIYATRDITIAGTVEAPGFDAENQDSLSSAEPILGASGNLGGGNGGTASPSAVPTEPDSSGGSGFGPFGVPNFGGSGGESGFGHVNESAAVNTWKRRVGGGGGGVTTPTFFANQSGAGIIPTSGNNGSIQTGTASNTVGMFGAISGTSPPRGGNIGSSLFLNSTPDDNFFGLKRFGSIGQGADMQGELASPTAGSGGGAGGDSIKQTNYPGNFVPGNNMRGASGAGGGGLLEMSCLGIFTITGQGQIDVRGGRGGRGERTLSAWFGSAGGSGGGSGGHLILQTARHFAFNTVDAGTFLLAAGGLGGPGSTQNGPVAIYGSAGSGEAGGGDGSAGIIQLHVSDDGSAGTGWENVVLSPNHPTINQNVGRPNPQVCYPTFGAFSRAQSKAIPLGGAILNPTGPNQVNYSFSALQAGTGFIATNPPANTVVTTEPILLTATAISVSNASKTIVVDATTLFNDTTKNLFLRNTKLLRQSRVGLSGPATAVVTVVDAVFDEPTKLLTMNIEAAAALAPFETGTVTVNLRPRFYRAITGTAFDTLDAQARVKIEFQALDADINGLPGAELVPWTTDVTAFNNIAFATNKIDYFKYRVTFDIDKGNGTTPDGLTGLEGLPALDFLRLMFEF